MLMPSPVRRWPSGKPPFYVTDKQYTDLARRGYHIYSTIRWVDLDAAMKERIDGNKLLAWLAQ